MLAQSDAIDALRFSFAETEARLHKTLKATVVSALRDGVREHAEGGEQDGGYADSYEEEEARPPTLDDATLRGRQASWQLSLTACFLGKTFPMSCCVSWTIQLWNEPSDIDAARHRGEWGSYPCGHSIALSRSQADLDQVWAHHPSLPPTNCHALLPSLTSLLSPSNSPFVARLTTPRFIVCRSCSARGGGAAAVTREGQGAASPPGWREAL